jgi:putative spermidine/putrescine transport system permease protein
VEGLSRRRTWPPLYVVFVLVLLFMVAPLVIVIVNSFNASAYSEWPPTGFSTKWYAAVLAYPAFASGAEISVIVGAGASVVSLIVGAMAAFALVRFRIPGARLVQTLYFAPLTVPRVAIGFALFSLFIASGSQLYGTLQGLIIAHTLVVMPFVITIFVSNLGGIDPVYEEAARDLGAGRLRVFWSVTLPQMRTGFVVAALFAFVTSFDELEMSIFLVRPQVQTLPISMFFYLEQQQTPTLAALSTLLIALAIGLVLIALPFLLRGRGGWSRLITIGGGGGRT